MVIKRPDDVPEREVTPKDVYVNRRWFMRGAVAVGSVVTTAAVYRALNPVRHGALPGERLANVVRPGASRPAGAATTAPATAPTTAASVAEASPAAEAPAYDEQTVRAFHTDEPQTTFEAITNYNNFYEFSTDKGEVAYAARDFVAKPWTVEVSGLCAKPTLFDLDDL